MTSGRNGVANVPRRIPLGSHLVSPRIGYTHHGIYVGRGRVIHYSGMSNGNSTGPVEVASIAVFSAGRPVRILHHSAPAFSAKEIVNRARSRVGEDLYHLLWNNCEHFCQWCVTGIHDSPQVTRGVVATGGTAATAGLKGSPTPLLRGIAGTGVLLPPIPIANAVAVAVFAFLAYTRAKGPGRGT
jgi:hypothetical protein